MSAEGMGTELLEQHDQHQPKTQTDQAENTLPPITLEHEVDRDAQGRIICTLCKMKFTYYNSYRNHCLGKKHRAALSQSLGLDTIDVNKVDLPEGITDLSSIPTSDDGAFLCMVCKSKFTGYGGYSDHLVSKKHKENMENPQVEPETNWLEIKFPVPEECEVTKNQDGMIVCATCNIPVNGYKTFVEHWNGSKHQENMKKPPSKSKKFSSAAPSKVKPIAMSSKIVSTTNFSCPQEKDITLTVDRKFPCSLCRMTLNSYSCFVDHWHGKSHQDKMKKKYPGYRGDYFPDKTAPAKDALQVIPAVDKTKKRNAAESFGSSWKSKRVHTDYQKNSFNSTRNYHPQDYPLSDYPPSDYPPSDYAPPDYPPQEYPPQEYPPQQYPPQEYPPQEYPPQVYPPQVYPPQEYPPQKYPPQKYPSQDYPPQDYPTQEDYHSQSHPLQTHNHAELNTPHNKEKQLKALQHAALDESTSDPSSELSVNVYGTKFDTTGHMRIVSDLEADAMLYMCHRMMGAVLKYKASTKNEHQPSEPQSAGHSSNSSPRKQNSAGKSCNKNIPPRFKQLNDTGYGNNYNYKL